MCPAVDVRDAVDWRHRALCRGQDPNCWSVDHGRGPYTPTAGNRYAIHLCERCPVRVKCDQTATDERWIGVIAGGVPRGADDGRKLTLLVDGPAPPSTRPKTVELQCAVCQRWFRSNRTHARYCGQDCVREAKRRRTALARRLAG